MSSLPSTIVILNNDRPNPNCVVCTNAYLGLTVDPEMTLQELLLHLSDEGSKPHVPGELTIQHGDRLLYDIEYDDHLDKSLETLIKSGDELLITNDNDEDENLNHSLLIFCHFDKGVERVQWTGDLLNLPKRPAPAVEEPNIPSSPMKRPFEEEPSPSSSKAARLIVLDDNLPSD
jgi:hypothetical protein